MSGPASTPPAATEGECHQVNSHLLYHQVVIPSQQVLHTIEGSFTLPNAHDVVMIRHQTLELWTLHGDTGRMQCVHATPLLTDVYAAVAVSTGVAVMTSGRHRSKRSSSHSIQRDGVHYLAITSETGYATLLRYELAEPPMPTRVSSDGSSVSGEGTAVLTTSLRGSFVKVSEVLLGRSGARVITPGMKMVVDDSGSALFITALMRCKVVVPILKTDVDASTLRTMEELDAETVLESDGEESDLEGEEATNGSIPRKRKRTKRKANGVITFGSPIEVHRHTIIYSTCTIEGSTQTAMFAALEEEIAEALQSNPTAAPQNSDGGAFVKVPGASSPTHRKTLVVYAYVASLKQVQRTHLIYPPVTSHRLISLPASPSGPGGVLVCTDYEVIWYDLSTTADLSTEGGVNTGVFKCTAAFPRRVDLPKTSYNPSVIAHAITVVTSDYFLLVQDENGDVYRVSISNQGVQAAKNAFKMQKGGPGAVVKNPLAVHYYETISPAKAMALFRLGFLFVASDGGSRHCLYQVKEGYTTEKEYVVKTLKFTESKEENVSALPSLPGSLPPPTARPAIQPRTVHTFQPHAQLKHLFVKQEFPNTPPIASMCATVPTYDETDSSVQQQEQVQITSVCGRGASSVVAQARYGYSTRTLTHATLPTAYVHIIALTSSSALQEYRAMQKAILEELLEARKAHGGREDNPQRVKRALRRLASMARQFRIGTDKVVVSTTKGTAVFSIGTTVDQDMTCGFESSERTLSASTLEDGKGYLQVTPHSLYVLPAFALGSSSCAVEPLRWSHSSGKSIVAAATTPYSSLLAFAGGGITSFRLDWRGRQLKEQDTLPNFPRSTAVALLQPPASALTNDVSNELQAALSNNTSHANERSFPELAAVATASGEVYLLMPNNLQKPLDIIRSDESVSGTAEICSVLLTYLNDTSESGILRAQQRQKAKLRLFCFIGYGDGTLVRCEIDRSAGTVVERQELSCGNEPCLLIAGDGETMCYAKCGAQCWRCGMSAGVPKVMPWRYPARQKHFSRFAMPYRPSSLKLPTAEEEGETIQLGAATPQEELVISLHNKELVLFSAQQMGTGPSALEYSLVTHHLPVAGRRLVQHPTHPKYFLIAGVEHRGFSSAVQQQSHDPDAAMLVSGPKRSLNRPGQYISSLQLFHEEKGLLPCYTYEAEAVMCATIGSFSESIGKEPIIVAGVARNFHHGTHFAGPPTWKDGALRSFRCAPSTNVGVDNEGRPLMRLELLHHTLVESNDGQPDYPSALCVCEDVGLLVVGMGPKNGLRLYSCGHQQFLFKCQLQNVPARITAVEVVFSSPPTGAMSPSFYIQGLYQCPNMEARTRAAEKQLLIVCGTDTDSVFVAAMQPKSSNTPFFLMVVARDRVPRHLTCMVVVDERTFGLADRFGNVVFLRMPDNLRTGFAEPTELLTEAELNVIQQFASTEQLLEEVAVHHAGQLVTSLRVQEVDPSGGLDPSLRTRVVYYGTALGAVGCYTPFVSEADGAFGAYIRPLLREHLRLLLQPGEGHLPYHWNQHRGLGHHVVEGEWLDLFRQSSTELFSHSSREAIKQRLTRLRTVEKSRREFLQLPPRELPEAVVDLVATQRTLSTLPL